MILFVTSLNFFVEFMDFISTLVGLEQIFYIYLLQRPRSHDGHGYDDMNCPSIDDIFITKIEFFPPSPIFNKINLINMRIHVSK